MNGKQVKAMRAQIRNVVLEILDEVLAREIFKTLDSDLKSELKERLDLIHKEVREGLERMDNRHKDVTSMIVREMLKAPEVKTSESEAPVVPPSAEVKAD